MIKFTNKFLIAGGARVGVTYSAGPWVEGVNPDTIKIRPRRASCFPAAVREAVAVENNSDSREDYFEADCIRLVPGHPLYEQAKQAAA